MGDTITISAGAKVNPTLVVRGRRLDGYHDIETVLLGLDLRDEIKVSLAPAHSPTTVTTHGPFASADIPTDAANLAARGAHAAAAALGIETSFHIHVQKRIPSRAGLGGGSSDAAAAALGAAVLLNGGAAMAPPVDQRITAALGEIGVDCAFFFAARDHGAALAVGKGEAVEPLRIHPDVDVVLITPSVDCPTPAVYGALGLANGEDLNHGGDSLTLASASALLTGSADAPEPRNDLESAALGAFPELRPWQGLLQGSTQAKFMLSGSGSSFFTLAPTGTGPSILEAVTKAAQGAGLSYRLATVARPSGGDLLQ